MIGARVLQVQRPLALIAAGLVLVAVDFRTESLDYLCDPVGWLLVAAAAAALSLSGTAWLSAAAALLSLSDAFLPYRTVFVDPETNKGVEQCPVAVCAERVEFDLVSGWRLVALAGVFIVGGAAVLSLLGGLRSAALRAGDRSAGTRLSLLFVGVGLGWALPPLMGMVWAVASEDRRYDPVWNGAAEYVALAGLLMLAWLVIELLQRGGAAWATPRRTETASPSRWGALRQPRT